MGRQDFRPVWLSATEPFLVVCVTCKMAVTLAGLIKILTQQCFSPQGPKTMFGLLILLSLFFLSVLHIIVFKDVNTPVYTYTYQDSDLMLPSNNERGLTSDENIDQSGGKTKGSDKRNLQIDEKDVIREEYFSMGITEADIEDLSVELPQTMPSYRNPCWVEMVPDNFSYMADTLYYQYYRLYPEHQPPRDWQETYNRMESLLQARMKADPDNRGWRLRCFPYFFLLGFTKAGTSDLRRSLSKLPDFVSGIIKEPKFWNKIRVETHIGADVLPIPTLSDYLDLYDQAAEDLRHYVNVTSEGVLHHPGIIGDFDPQTIWQMPTWQTIKGNENQDEPRYITAHHLYALRPQTKLIVLMREPVERAFSHYRFFKARKTGSHIIHPEKIHEDMDKAINKLNNCFKEKSERACVYFPWKYDPTSMRSITVSMYDIYIEDWLNVFPREQFLFLRSEDYFNDRISVIREILQFLDIDTKIPKSLVKRMEKLPAMNPSTKSGMDNETRILLQNFFKPMNLKLSSILNDDKWLWN